MPKHEITIEGEFLPHRMLWLAADTLHTQRERVDAPAYSQMAALLFTYLALEAFLNYLGEEVCPEVWKDERTFFVREWRGTLGKLNYLAREVGLAITRDRRPYQTVKELDRRRDSLVHPRPHRFTRTVRTAVPGKHREEDPLMLDFADGEFYERARYDVGAVCDSLLHSAPEFVRRTVGDSAFFGRLNHQTTWLPDEHHHPGAPGAT